MKIGKSQTSELWQTTYHWLSGSGIKLDKVFCRQEITTHPDYPAMTAVTDFLDAGNMRYNAVQADASYIHEFSYPLLAHIKQPGQEHMHIISNAAEWEGQKEITQHWSGIVVYPEKDSQWHHKDNDASQKQKAANNVYFITIIVTAILLYGYSVYNTLHFSYAIFGLLSISGLLISAWIIGSELGIQNTLVKQVCGAVSEGGCDKVLKSNYAKGLAGFTTGDITIVYFAAQFFAFLLTSFSPLLFNTILLMSLPGIVVSGWSIYTQALKLNKWCALCLGIVVVLMGQFGIAFFIMYNTGISAMIILPEIMSIAILILVFALLVLPVKKILKENYINKQKLTELKKWKMDAGIFMAQWQNELRVDTTIWDDDIIFGDPDAPIKIIVACNPYCQPCAVAHEKLEEILVRNPKKICVLVRFLCDPNDENDRRTIFVKSYLQVKKSINNTQAEIALSDWFKEMDYSKWSNIWKPTNNINVQNDLQKHSAWVNESRIYGTPSFFINSKKLPGRYLLADFEQLIPQLIGQLTA